MSITGQSIGQPDSGKAASEETRASLPPFAVRPVWFLPAKAVSYATERDGEQIYGRRPDAYGVYERESDGTLNSVEDYLTGGWNFSGARGAALAKALVCALEFQS
jgi:hypothetical protein